MQSAQLRAACPSSYTSCSSFPTTATVTATVQAPLLPVIPSAELIGPSSIARCDNLTIASIITNSGGKPLSYYWTVTANGAAASTALATYVSKVNTKVCLLKHALLLSSGFVES